MLELIIFILCTYGISNMIVFASGPFRLFEIIREVGDRILPSNLSEMFHCMICFPTWVGIVLSLINMFIFNDVYFTPFYQIVHNTDNWLLICLLDGCVASGSTWLLHTLQEHFEIIEEDDGTE